MFNLLNFRYTKIFHSSSVTHKKIAEKAKNKKLPNTSLTRFMPMVS